MGAPRADPGLKPLIASLDGDAEGRMGSVSAFIVNHTERRRAHDADDATISSDPVTQQTFSVQY